MPSTERVASPRPRRSPVGTGRQSRLLAGGIDGNERLTTITGLILIVLLGALGVTILFIGRLLWEHLFLGLLLIGPVTLKLMSTGYRFTKYYTGNPVYVRRGPPWTPLRLLAPIVVLSTLGVFLTGVVLLFVGPAQREPWLLLHKASFVIWLLVTALHILGHLPEVNRLLGLRSELLELPGIRSDLAERGHDYDRSTNGATLNGRRVAPVRGGASRAAVLAASLVLGLGLGVGLIPDYGTWTSAAASFIHQDH